MDLLESVFSHVVEIEAGTTRSAVLETATCAALIEISHNLVKLLHISTVDAKKSCTKEINNTM